MRVGDLFRAAAIVRTICAQETLSQDDDARAATTTTDDNRFCFDACVSGVQSVRFADAEVVAFPAVCYSKLAGLSLLLCSRVYCGDAGGVVVERATELNETCEAAGRALPRFEEATAYPDEKLELVPRLTVENRTRGDEVHEIVIPLAVFHKQWIDTLVS
jgi:hypothetical protein